MDIKTLASFIGHTPLLDVTPPDCPSKIHAKAEYYNLTGSVKDRAAFFMLREGLEKGILQSPRRIVEATSGNTGIGLAVIGRLLGFSTTLVLPPQASLRRRQILESAGAELIFSDPGKGPNGALEIVSGLYQSEPDKWFWPNQYYNPVNYMAHFATADEVFQQTNGKVSHMVSATGTGGTAIGTAKRLKSLKPDVKVISVEPAEELHGIEGTKHMETEAVPVISVQGKMLAGIFEANRTVLDDTVFVTTDDAYRGINLLAGSGIFAGISSGANYMAACRIAFENPGSTVVTVFPDSSDRYLSEPLWDEKYYGITLPYQLVHEMSGYFSKAYPREGCGLLLGRRSEGKAKIESFAPVENNNLSRAHDRYEIDPRDYRKVEREAGAKDMKIIGIVHSHPDHPAFPSVTDLETAWEDLSYLIFSVISGGVVVFKSWKLPDGSVREFREELIFLGDVPGTGKIPVPIL
jgi:S-sulfo-L-cysteine synthase (O-acetyl-L-serine-dependent)